ncbi:MAG TPA: Gfo/Idh/MocA family oxidoreductase [Acidimicrobiia bacterium]|nr:Gfo/Idh/MocA family oxidoreductase [Acidimicrobiia bacterium]
MDRVRIGTLGAARITPMALVRPARRVDDVEIVAVAARDRSRAERFAAKHGIPRVLTAYDDLVADPDVDAVYIPLPNGLHAEWTLKAIEAGKHVLCEKPFTSNADQAREVAAAAKASDRVVMEAFHYRFHPLARRMRDIVESGELGEVRHIETAFCIPLPIPGDIRYRLDLAGGATMDVGCYAVNLLRYLAGSEPEVVDARAALLRAGIDRAMTARFRFADGRTGAMSCSLLSRRVARASARVVGDRGEMRVFNPFGPQYLHRLRVRTPEGSRTERLTRQPTYLFQLQAFAAAVLAGADFECTVDDAVANMEIVDAVYQAAGMEPRS